jgi:ankyrin repeat protein
MVIRLLLHTGKAGAEPKDISGWTPLTRVASYGHEAVVRLLLETVKFKTALRNGSSWTPLSHAASIRHEAAVYEWPSSRTAKEAVLHKHEQFMRSASLT